MYNKKYRIEKIEELNRHNFVYEGVEGSICYPAYFNVGERGWFLFIEDTDLYEYAHRIHTSTVKNVEYFDDYFIVETRNTRFVFRLVNEAND